MYKLIFALALFVGMFAPGSPARAYTCGEHYGYCIQYRHGPVKCGCARKVCQKQMGSKDAGGKWNWIPGVNACFGR